MRLRWQEQRGKLAPTFQTYVRPVTVGHFSFWEVFTMGIRNRRKEVIDRLGSKTLDAQFSTEIQQGLGCSPFESEAVLEVVREVYFPFLGVAGAKAPPGKVTLIAVAADEPAGKPVADCQKQTVCLTLHRGREDDRLIFNQGPAAFRQARLLDLCQQALSQGGLLTAEDLAYRIFFVTPRTISRDLLVVRKASPNVLIPMRSTLHDIGPVLTHRTQIVRLALQGKTTTQICKIMRHSPEAVANYLSTFTRCTQLAQKKLQVGQIAFLLRRSQGLVRSYLDILAECRRDHNLKYHLDELLRIGTGGAAKKNSSREDLP
jgi:DNA-binding CsgD family transcriptional regulator